MASYEYTPTLANEFREAAGLQRTSSSRRRSSAEKIIEESFRSMDNPTKSSSQREFYAEKQKECLQRHTSQDGHQQRRASKPEEDSIPEERPRRKSSTYQLKNINPPIPIKGRRVSLRTEKLFSQFEKDMNQDTKTDVTKGKTEKELEETKMCRQKFGSAKNTYLEAAAKNDHLKTASNKGGIQRDMGRTEC